MWIKRGHLAPMQLSVAEPEFLIAVSNRGHRDAPKNRLWSNSRVFEFACFALYCLALFLHIRKKSKLIAVNANVFVNNIMITAIEREN